MVGGDPVIESRAEQVAGRDGSVPRQFGWLERSVVQRVLEGVVVGLFLLAFVQAAQAHADQFNRKESSSDQGAYLEFAEHTARNILHLDGSRGPGYPIALLLVHDETLDREAFFLRAKTFTVYLTAALWLGMWLLLRRALPVVQGLVAWVVIGMTCLISYAPYVKAEGPYFAVNWFAFVLLGAALLKATPRAALVAGVVTGAAYLFKNSARILLITYALAALLDFGLRYFRAEGQPRARLGSLKPRLNASLLVLLGFLAICAPFLIASKHKYGHAFYNVNDFYAWYDSWAEVKTGTRAYGDRDGWPQMSDQDIPTAQKYVASHSYEQLKDRLRKGWRRSLNGFERRSMLSYAKIYLGVLVVLAAVRYRHTAALARRYGPLVFFGATYLVGHSIMSAWFEVIATGPRVLAAGFPILIAASALAIFKLSEHPPRERKLWRHAAAATTLVAAIWLTTDVPRVVGSKVHGARGGR
jgi:hypothetical protein